MKLITLILITLFLSAQPLAWAAESTESHDHHAGTAQLELNDGKKWETDDSLRNGMTQIKNALEAEIGPIHKNTLPRTKYEALATKISGEINSIFKKCKLSPKADAMLHVVLMQIIDGNKAMKSAKKLDDRRAGAVKIIGALGQYEKYFDHPGWTPIKH